MPTERVERRAPSSMEELEQLSTAELEALVAADRKRRLRALPDPPVLGESVRPTGAAQLADAGEVGIGVPAIRRGSMDSWDTTGPHSVVIPLSDGMPPRRFPIVTTAIIAVNVWCGSSTSSRASTLRSSTRRSIRARSTARAMARAGVDQLGDLDVLARELGSHPREHALPRGLREERRGSLRQLPYLLFYFAGGLAATVTQTAVTLLAGTSADAQTPNLGASGAIAAVLGAYFILFPGAQIRGLLGAARQALRDVLSRLLVPLPVVRGELRPLRVERARRRRRVLRPRRWVRLRRRGRTSALVASGRLPRTTIPRRVWA